MPAKETLKPILALILGITIFTAMLFYFGIEEVVAAFAKASPEMLLFFVLTSFIFYFLRALRWKVILLPIKNPVKTSNLFWATMVGYFVNSLIPIRVGELTRAFLIDRAEQTGFSKTLSSIAIERLLDLIAVATLGIIALYWVSISLPIPEIATNILKLVAALILAALIILLAALKFKEKILNLLAAILAKLPIKQRWKDKSVGFLESLVEGAKIIVSRPKLMAASMLLSWAVWLSGFLTLYAVFKAFSLEAELPVLLLGYILLMITFIAPAAPGYVGSFEAFWLLIFLALGLAGSSLLLATAIAYHALTLLFIAATGSLGLTIMGISLSEAIKVERPSLN